MSGSGGFYKYRCKYFYTHNCNNWVYINHTPCANCCAEGRDVDQPATETASWSFSRDIYVPRIEDGVMSYTIMEIVNPNGAGNYWTVRYKVNQNSAPIVVPTTNTTPGAPMVTANR
ncbi:hypothetical protein DL770_010718 [Monosporascus sp. CRB-9-2]|nr:hypothetical protein DL770_010718 [Monosporascus sp. CRB-9-2]